MAASGAKKALKKTKASKTVANKQGKKSKDIQEEPSKVEEEQVQEEPSKVESEAESEGSKTEDFSSDDAAADDAAAPKENQKEKSGKRQTKADRFNKFADDSDDDDKAEAKNIENRGLVFLKYVPFGFFEPQMKQYFEQFGDVTRVRLSRSKKTGRSRGYGWVEFADKEVAKIAQETMDGYLMFGHKLVVKSVPDAERPRKLFLPKYKTKVQCNWADKRRGQFRKKFNDRSVVVAGGEEIPQRTVQKEWLNRSRKKKLGGVLAKYEIDFDLDGMNKDQDQEIFDDARVKGVSWEVKRKADKDTPPKKDKKPVPSKEKESSPSKEAESTKPQGGKKRKKISAHPQ